MRDRIALVRPTFPRDVKDPLVMRVENENSQPVASLAVMSQTTPLRELTSLTDQTIVKALEHQPGVARIDVNGRMTRQMRNFPGERVRVSREDHCGRPNSMTIVGPQ